MSDDLDERFDNARERLDARDRLRRERTETLDTLAQQEYHLRRLEAGLDQISREVRTLESAGLSALLHALMGSRQAKLDEKRGDMNAAQKEFETVTAAVNEVRARLDAIERQLGELADVEAEFAALFEEREKAVLDRGDETAEQLREVLVQLAWCQEEARKTHLAVEAAEAVLKRIGTMNTALMRARKNQITVHGASLVNAGWNALKAHGAKEHVARVREGLERLHRQLTGLDAAGEAQHDLEIHRMMPLIEHAYTEELTKNWEQWAVLFTDAGHPMERDVHALLNQLEERLHCCRKDGDALERQRRRLIEGGIANNE